MTEAIRHSLVTALRNVPSLELLDDATLLRVVGASSNLIWPAGAIVFDVGSPSEGLYVVLSGGVGIFAVQDGAEQQVAGIGVGDFFGEMSLLHNSTHTRRARALEESELLILPTESFRALLEREPALEKHIRDKLGERLKELERTPRS